MGQRLFPQTQRQMVSIKLILIAAIFFILYNTSPIFGQQDTIPPTTPREVNARPRNANSVELYWLPSVDNAGVTYRIYRNIYSNPILVGTADSSGLGRIAFVDSNLTPNTNYNYGASAIDPSGNESSIGTGSHGHSDTVTPPAGYTISTQVFYPDTVAPGEDIVIRQIITCSPAGTLGHHDIHWDTTMVWVNDFRANFPSSGQRTLHDYTVTITAPSTPGNFYFMDDGHLFDNGWNNAAHKEGMFFRIIVTQGNPLVISPQQLAAGQIGEQYTQQLTVSGEGTAPFFWGVTNSRLPNGLLLDGNTGVISGIPTEPGLFQITVMVEGADGVTAFRNYQLNIDQTVPVELVNFEVNATENNVELSWETATETNNFGFEIDRKILSLTGEILQEWHKIGFVKGHGTVVERRSYRFFDSDLPLSGRYVYKLKQIDLDGSHSYYGEVSVQIGSENAGYQLLQPYPNPYSSTSRESISIEFYLPESTNLAMKIFNIIGQEVRILTTADFNQGWHKIAWDGLDKNGNMVSDGLYFYQLSTVRFIEHQKILIMGLSK